MPPKIAKLFGLGAFGACAGLVALYAGLLWLTMPTRTGGIDQINASVAWIALGGLIVFLVVAHVAIGKQLLLLAKGAGEKHPL